MPDFKHLKEGDSVVFVRPRQRMEPSIDDGKVVKVGRKYLTVEYGDRWPLNETFERDSGLEKRDGYTSYRAFLIHSREAYEEDKRIDALWHKFYNAMRNQYHVPDGLTREKIATAAALLNVDLKLNEEEN